jgi:dTDP-glucose pyrophosphorylase
MQNRLMIFRKNEDEYSNRLKNYDKNKVEKLSLIDSDIEKAKNELQIARTNYKKVDITTQTKLNDARNKLEDAINTLEKQRKSIDNEESKLSGNKYKFN